MRHRRYGARPMMRLEIHPYGPEFLDDAAAPARAAPCRPARRRAGAAGRVRAARRGARGDRGARDARTPRAPSPRAAARSSATCSGRRATTRPGGRTSGSSRPGTPSRWPRMCAISTRSRRRRWVEEGRTSHYAIVPAGDAALIDAWFRLGFGQQHVHAIREAPDDAAHRAAGRARDPHGRRATTSTCSPSSSSRCRRTSMRRPSSRRSAPPPLEEAIGRVGGGLRRPEVRHLRRRRRRAGRRLRDRLLDRPSPACTRGSCGPTTPGSSASRPCSRRPGAPASAGRSARPCSTGRRPRATPWSSPTGGRRTCCRRAPGRSSGTGRRSSACFRAIA